MQSFTLQARVGVSAGGVFATRVLLGECLYNFFFFLQRKGPVSGTFMLFAFLSAVTKRFHIFVV